MAVLTQKYKKLKKTPEGRVRVATGIYPYSQDAFRQRPSPSQADLAAAFRNAQYICAMRNAEAVASIPLHFYVITNRGQAPPRKHFVQTKAISRYQRESLEGNETFQKRLASAQHVEEVVSHPVVDMFNWVNPWLNKFSMITLTQLYKEIVGASYWTFAYLTSDYKGDRKRVPVEIWPLPAWLVYPTPDFSGTGVIRNFILTTGGGQTILPPEDVVFFRTLSTIDPYTGTMGPLRAGWDYSGIQDKLVEYEDMVLSNRARPDAILIPKEDGATISSEEQQRLRMMYYQDYGLARAGGLWVAPGGVDLKAMSWAPRDMGELASMKSTLHAVARIFGIPIPLIDAEGANRSAYDSALLDYQRHTIKPRCRSLEEQINSDVMPMFDERLFCSFDNPVPQDEVVRRETDKVYFAMGVRSPNEMAVEQGLPPAEGGDDRFVQQQFIPLAIATDRARRNITSGLDPANPDEIPEEARDPQRSPEEPEEGQDGEDHDSDSGVDSENAPEQRKPNRDTRPKDGRDKGVPSHDEMALRIVETIYKRMGLSDHLRADVSLPVPENSRIS